MRRDSHEVTLWHVTLRNPREALLLNPIQLPLVAVLLAVSVVFTLWPTALDHAPVSFEERGLVHHVWHYALMVGSAATLAGMLSAGARRLRTELVGLSILIGTLGVNLVAEVAGAVEAGHAASGLDVALRAAAVLGLTVRAYIVATEPTVDLRGQTSAGD